MDFEHTCSHLLVVPAFVATDGGGQARVPTASGSLAYVAVVGVELMCPRLRRLELGMNMWDKHVGLTCAKPSLDFVLCI